jgi:outer membrane lipoprotein-sorting protein
MTALQHRFFAPIAFAALLAGMARPAPAQTAGAIPKPPPAPASPLFADELAGRRLLWAARDAYQAAPTLRFSAQWSIKTDLGAKTEAATGTETIAAEPAARRLALTTESLTGGDRQIRRAVANGSSLLATRFRARPGGKAPAREFVRVLLTPENTLPGALRQVQVAPATHAGALLLDPEWTVRGVTWRGKGQAVNGVQAHEVWATEAARQREYEGDIRAQVATRRRYLLDPETHFLLRYEEWTTAEPLNGAARKAKSGYPRATYRREDYGGARAAQAPLPAALFGQALPPGYTETALPSVSLPSPRGPQVADREAQRLLTRWARARERLLSYFAQIEVTERRGDEAGEARQRAAGAPRQGVIYTAWVHNPGRVRLTLETTGLPEQRRRSLLAVADGRQATVYDRVKNEVRRSPLEDPSDLDRGVGFDDEGDALEWLFEPPIDEYDQVVYRGRRSLDGEAVEVLELTEDETDREDRRQGREEKVATTVALGADGLPRQIERRRERSANESASREAVVDRGTTVRYRQVRVDEEPPRGAFAFEPPPNAKVNERGRGARRDE